MGQVSSQFGRRGGAFCCRAVQTARIEEKEEEEGKIQELPPQEDSSPQEQCGESDRETEVIDLRMIDLADSEIIFDACPSSSCFFVQDLLLVGQATLEETTLPSVEVQSITISLSVSQTAEEDNGDQELSTRSVLERVLQRFQRYCEERRVRQKEKMKRKYERRWQKLQKRMEKMNAKAETKMEEFNARRRTADVQ